MIAGDHVSAQSLGLVEALIDGAFDAPPWSRFLETLCRAMAADYAILLCRPPGRPMDEGLQLGAGESRVMEVAEKFKNFFYPKNSVPRLGTEEGAPYSLADLQRLGEAHDTSSCTTLVDEFGIVGLRYLRVREPRGVEGWLIIARSEKDFEDRASGLLAALAGPLRSVLRVHVAGESDRFRARMAAEAVRRMRCGWFLLDEEGYVLSADPFGESILSESEVLSRNSGGKLVVRPADLEREIFQNVAKLASERNVRPRAISLRSDPWLDMLLVPGRTKMISDTAVPTVIAYVHSDNWRSAERYSQLSDLFDLSRSEAKLALALCRGKSIAEAAMELGLALETARSYSKSIYAKTGTRGMADLVRIIMGSILTLAPDA